MLITFLGHAGFCVETEHAVIVMDPWLSPAGAFDSSWFQLPRNHHLAPLVQHKLANTRKAAFIYISHEHKDHFDPEFLKTLHAGRFSFVIPRFRNGVLESELKRISSQDVISCADGQEVSFKGGSLKVYVDDSGLNRDSAVLFRTGTQSFLNMNDCKIFERLPEIVAANGAVDIFSCQFSGATWHPICYRYDHQTYTAISRKRALGKFESVARAIETLRPRLYLPAAGPPCFLDRRLLHLNFEPVNIFPRAPELLRYLKMRLKQSSTRSLEMMPGDVLDSHSESLCQTIERVTDDNFRSYVLDYAVQMAPLFLAQRDAAKQTDPVTVLRRLERELTTKITRMQFDTEQLLPLYFSLEESPDRLLRVDFEHRTVKETEQILDPDRFYSIQAPAWQVAKVLDRALTWEDFALTFRAQLNRNPDIYQTLLNGFLFMEAEDLAQFCARVLSIQRQQETIEVTARGRTYLVDRYCPHQRGDLSQGWIEEGHLLTCPRHRWQFDLEKGGVCTTNQNTIHAAIKNGHCAVPPCATPRISREDSVDSCNIQLSHVTNR